MKPLSMGLLLAMTSTSVWANPLAQWEQGFSGDISLLTGFSNTKSQFNTDIKSTPSLESSGESDTKALIAPLGAIQYTFASDKQVFMGTSRSDLALGRFHIEAGYRQLFEGNGMVSLSYVPGIIGTETWEDPFLVNENRTKTDTKIKGFRFQYKNILGSNFSMETSVGQQEIDSEKSGQKQNLSETEIASLDREGDIIYLEGAYRQSIARGRFLRGALNYTRFDADGDAMSYDTYGAQLSIIQMLPSSSLALTFGYKNAQYEAENPVFDEKQKDDLWSVFLAYEYNEPFGWTNWGLVSLIGYNTTDSNINFYNEDTLMATVGINYKF
ncbi:DUF2860 domain-containing protein [Photobacterium frigidiphilum]|uniref:DUF2860 domain-containing protein n=1 Tax=Photobacterium frigidiphilum TaxID=264736 RepID=A0A2T3JKS1_9GAMM|nr:DUF2860 domain-containing protein [Photobacterium frigidiphilum]PSU49520.1 DUF2860 domain-containing protein [Photobacterium frigidiphilum]